MDIINIKEIPHYIIEGKEPRVVTPWACEYLGAEVTEPALELCKHLVVKSAEEHNKIYSQINNIDVNLTNEQDFIDFISIMLAIDVINNAFVSNTFKLDTEAGFSSYNCGYHGWVKQIHALRADGVGILTLPQFIEHLKDISNFPQTK